MTGFLGLLGTKQFWAVVTLGHLNFIITLSKVVSEHHMTGERTSFSGVPNVYDDLTNIASKMLRARGVCWLA